MDNDDRLKLSESFHSYLEKAITLHTHLKEDWHDIRPSARHEDLPDEFGIILDKAQASLREHRQKVQVESEAKRDYREIKAETLRLYKRCREIIRFYCDEYDYVMKILAKYPDNPTNDQLMEGMLVLPPYVVNKAYEIPEHQIADYQGKKAEEWVIPLDSARALADRERVEQVSLRIKRDHIFRELREFVTITKATGKFVFSNNPERKRRYR